MLSELLPDELVLEIAAYLDFWTFYRFKRASRLLLARLVLNHPPIRYVIYRGEHRAHLKDGRFWVAHYPWRPDCIYITEFDGSIAPGWPVRWSKKLTHNGVSFSIAIIPDRVCWDITIESPGLSLHMTPGKCTRWATSPRKINNPSWATLLKLIRLVWPPPQ